MFRRYYQNESLRLWGQILLWLSLLAELKANYYMNLFTYLLIWPENQSVV